MLIVYRINERIFNMACTYKNNLNYYSEFYSIVKDLLANEKVQEMKLYRQHYDTSTFEHCFHVAYVSYKICKKLGLD